MKYSGGAYQCPCKNVKVPINVTIKVPQWTYSVVYIDLLIIIELIKDVALAFTTGIGDLVGGAASKVGSILSLS